MRKSRCSVVLGAFLLVAMLGLPAKADQQILDDLIVDGSACVGQDCVNGESFGFDTLRLKENNLRLHFQDTSSTASFPTTDWRLTANDSTNGGQNRFSIEDASASRVPFTVEGNAPNHSLYVDDGGRIGFGTSTPVVDLHVVSGNTPTLRLEQDGSSGFSAQTWDVAGNEANFFIRDATSGSTLPFRVFPGAPSNALNIEGSTGDIGIGTSNPDTELHVERSDASITVIKVENTNGATQQARVDLVNNARDWRLSNTGPIFRIRDNTGGVNVFNLRNTGAGINADPDATGTTHPLVIGTDNTNGNGAHVTIAGAFVMGSRRASKEQITDLDTKAATEALEQLNPVTYFGKGDPTGEKYVGFIAEDVPELVAVQDRSGLAAMDITAVVTKVVKEQQKTIKGQQKVIADLTERLKRLEDAAQADK